ncbi:MAG: pyruvate:ferredoxin (flavodoxin) oxidoreductase [Oscillospiraceae bacterium]|jgi:pyruvate-ferredoxin/flavodoxin oxidoreductase|nr:pyruvate:ferredoxin (flavodoxin) oxidoreductase [Oscillospiraceae bacterium]
MARKLKTMDGNTAAAHVSYAFSEVAAIYPITPSSTMAEVVDKWSAGGLKNIFGQTVSVVEMQSEGGAAGAVHGSLTAGALTTTYTASQGLLLMIPNMYKIAGEQLPSVIHVSARTLATHALSIFGDHSDVMGCRQTGYAMLASNSPQEAMDLGAVAHLSAIHASMPFLHFFDGFRTSHEMQKIEIWDFDELKEMTDFDAIADFRAKANNPEHPHLKGSAQNGDIFFQIREASNGKYEALPAVVEEYMDKVNAKIGTDYKLFNYYGDPDAEQVLVAMGSVCETAEEVVDFMRARGEKVGLIKVRLYRPFSAKHLALALPKSVKTLVVLDRTKEPGALGEPLYMDVVGALAGTEFAGVKVVGGRYGLSSKDVTPGAVISAFRNGQAASPKNGFTIGIVDDVTGLSIPITEEPDTTPGNIISCKFWGLGSDGTVGANKNSIKIIGDHTDKKAQAYFQYDSKKSGGVTISHLRFGDSAIKSAYYVSKADFVACHNPSYLEKYKMAQDVKPGGAFLINCAYTDAESLALHLPGEAMRYIAENKVRVYTIDAIAIAREIGLGGKTNAVLQSAFFKLANILPIDDAVKYMKEAIQTSYGRKGEKIVNMNYAAVDAGLQRLNEIAVPESWAKAEGGYGYKQCDTDRADLKKYVETILEPVNAMRGDELPVSVFEDSQTGTLPSGTSACEKRGIAVEVPKWIPENCIQCNQCAFVCPHAVIRPFVFDADELAGAPEGTATVKMNGKGCEDYKFAIIPTVLDCTGCASCANVCPAKEKALIMTPIAEMLDEQKKYDYAFEKVSDKEVPFAANTVKGSQFKQPLLEFSGACAGCGETPYAKLITQLFGDRMYIANATGCSSIWGGSAPSVPYTVNKKGKGPAWANSLFEDNAEFGLGMLHAVKQRRAAVEAAAKLLTELDYADETIAAAAKSWLDAKDDGEASKAAGAVLLELCVKNGQRDFTGTPYEQAWLDNGKKCPCDACAACRTIEANGDVLTKPSFWVLGGDGWAYDIGYGGLDHVLASGENINVLVFDTEVYSNTGGQASKATPVGAVAQFAAAGKSVKKKDLAQISISYGYIYVAQISMGASYQQALKAIMEAESYDGPSIVICYAPCINHGNKNGMGRSILTEKQAVEAGYWNLLRYDPRLEKPLSVDSKAPTTSYQDFIMNEVRYSSLKLAFPERAEKLFAEAEEQAKERYSKLIKQKEMLDE